jgi:YVTN family beta-propeller protein
MFAYVTNQRSNSVSVIDLASDTVVATVQVETQPAGVAISPNGNYVYVANFKSDSVSVIDAVSNSLVGSIHVGRSPFRIVVSPDGGYVYVTNTNSNDVSVIDAVSNAVVATVEVGSTPRGLAVTPNGKYVYVGATRSVVVIDAAQKTIVATLPTDTQCEPVAVTPDGKYVFVGQALVLEGVVSKFDTEKNALVGKIVIEKTPFGIAAIPNENRLYLTFFFQFDAGALTSMVLDSETLGIVSALHRPSQSSPRGLAVTSDGKRVYMAEEGIDAVSIIDTATNSVLKTMAVGRGPIEIALGSR